MSTLAYLTNYTSATEATANEQQQLRNRCHYAWANEISCRRTYYALLDLTNSSSSEQMSPYLNLRTAEAQKRCHLTLVDEQEQQQNICHLTWAYGPQKLRRDVTLPANNSSCGTDVTIYALANEISSRRTYYALPELTNSSSSEQRSPYLSWWTRAATEQMSPDLVDETAATAQMPPYLI